MHNCIRVVLIEDDQILLQTYKQLIEAEDDIVVVNGYTSFERAEKCLAMDQPDIILMDIQLPGISGIEAIRS
jgi:DNA-binding NarL/FixJ family response regulator